MKLKKPDTYDPAFRLSYMDRISAFGLFYIDRISTFRLSHIDGFFMYFLIFWIHFENRKRNICCVVSHSF